MVSKKENELGRLPSVISAMMLDMIALILLLLLVALLVVVVVLKRLVPKALAAVSSWSSGMGVSSSLWRWLLLLLT